MQEISIVMAIIGAFVGAGFASGQEIYLFFYKYGIYGIIGIALSCILIEVIIYKTLIVLKNNTLKNYKDFLDYYLSFNNKLFKNKKEKIKKILNILLNILILITFYIMISGFGAYFYQQYKINCLIGSGIISILCYFVLIKNVNFFIKLNKYIVPIVLFLVFIIGILNIKYLFGINVEKNINIFKAAFSGIIYASYNLILLLPVIITLNKEIIKSKRIKRIPIFFGFIFFILSLSLFSLLISVEKSYRNIEMPVMYALKIKYPILTGFYGIIILLSIFTTAISLGISFLNNIVKNNKNYKQYAFIMCITGFIFSKVGFSNMIRLLYPFFGIIGLIQNYIILRKNIEKKQKN